MQDFEAMLEALSIRRRAEGRRVVDIGGDRVEIRAIPAAASGLELRDLDGAGGPRITGHAAVYDVETELFPGFREVVRPGAFAKSLRRGEEVQALWNHNPLYLLGSSLKATGEGSLRVREDDHGLFFSLDPLNTPTVEDLVIAPLRAGILRGASFGFKATRAPQTTRGNHVLREIREADLVDVSPVSQPAYPEASLMLNDSRSQAFAAALEARGVSRADLISILSELPASPPSPIGNRATPRRDLLERALELSIV